VTAAREPGHQAAVSLTRALNAERSHQPSVPRSGNALGPSDLEALDH
jgi:hypothetical protein